MAIYVREIRGGNQEWTTQRQMIQPNRTNAKQTKKQTQYRELKTWATHTPSKPGVNPCARKRKGVPGFFGVFF